MSTLEDISTFLQATGEGKQTAEIIVGVLGTVEDDGRITSPMRPCASRCAVVLQHQLHYIS